MMNVPVFSVSHINRYVKSLFDSDMGLQSVFVSGEISNLSNHYKSGHMYFSLKDESASVKAVMFSRQASRLRFETACKSSHTFFIILTLVLMAMGGILSFIKADPMAIKSAMLWVSAITYALFLLRKFQIFNSSCSFFSSFLYLCALEILPTGALVASALIF